MVEEPSCGDGRDVYTSRLTDELKSRMQVTLAVRCSSGRPRGSFFRQNLNVIISNVPPRAATGELGMSGAGQHNPEEPAMRSMER